MKLDELTKPGCENAADYIRGCDRKYGTSELLVAAVVIAQTDDGPLAPQPTSFGECMECLDILPGISQMPQETSQPGSCHVRLGSGKGQLNTRKLGPAPAAEPDSSVIQNAQPVELVSFSP